MSPPRSNKDRSVNCTCIVKPFINASFCAVLRFRGHGVRHSNLRSRFLEVQVIRLSTRETSLAVVRGVVHLGVAYMQRAAIVRITMAHTRHLLRSREHSLHLRDADAPSLVRAVSLTGL